METKKNMFRIPFCKKKFQNENLFLNINRLSRNGIKLHFQKLVKKIAGIYSQIYRLKIYLPRPFECGPLLSLIIKSVFSKSEFMVRILKKNQIKNIKDFHLKR